MAEGANGPGSAGGSSGGVGCNIRPSLAPCTEGAIAVADSDAITTITHSTPLDGAHTDPVATWADSPHANVDTLAYIHASTHADTTPRTNSAPLSDSMAST